MVVAIFRLINLPRSKSSVQDMEEYSNFFYGQRWLSKSLPDEWFPASVADVYTAWIWYQDIVL